MGWERGSECVCVSERVHLCIIYLNVHTRAHTHTLSPPAAPPLRSPAPPRAPHLLPLGLPALSHQGSAAGSAPPGPLGAGNFPLRPARDGNPDAGCPAARVILVPDARPGHSPLTVLRVLPPRRPSAAVPPAPRTAAAPPGQRAPRAPSRRLCGRADNCGHTSKRGYPSTPGPHSMRSF